MIQTISYHRFKILRVKSRTLCWYDMRKRGKNKRRFTNKRNRVVNWVSEKKKSSFPFTLAAMSSQRIKEKFCLFDMFAPVKIYCQYLSSSSESCPRDDPEGAGLSFHGGAPNRCSQHFNAKILVCLSLESIARTKKKSWNKAWRRRKYRQGSSKLLPKTAAMVHTWYMSTLVHFWHT